RRGGCRGCAQHRSQRHCGDGDSESTRAYSHERAGQSKARTNIAQQNLRVFAATKPSSSRAFFARSFSSGRGRRRIGARQRDPEASAMAGWRELSCGCARRGLGSRIRRRRTASRTALEGVRGRQLAFAGMRFTFVLLGLGLVVVGCAPVRRAVDWSPNPAPRMRPSLDVARAPRPVSSALACVDQPLVHSWERRMRRDFAQDTRDTMARGARYLPELRQLVTDAGLPPSLALLPAIESGFEPQARGRFGELGLWQLRAATARRFGLVVDPQRDDRTDPARSTRAAARYLRFL